MKGTLRGLRMAATVSLVTLMAAASARADVVIDWNLQVFTSGGPQPQRTLAMVHLAMFDAINAIQPGYQHRPPAPRRKRRRQPRHTVCWCVCFPPRPPRCRRL